MLPRPLPTPRAFPSAGVSTTSPSKSPRTRAPHRADLTPRGAISLALVAVIALVTACSAAPPTRRDVVVGLVGEPQTVFDDDPSARFIASAVTETLVRRDAHDEFTPRLAESVPTLENGGLRVVTDDTDAPDGSVVGHGCALDGGSHQRRSGPRCPRRPRSVSERRALGRLRAWPSCHAEPPPGAGDHRAAQRVWTRAGPRRRVRDRGVASGEHHALRVPGIRPRGAEARPARDSFLPHTRCRAPGTSAWRDRHRAVAGDRGRSCEDPRPFRR